MRLVQRRIYPPGAPAAIARLSAPAHKALVLAFLKVPESSNAETWCPRLIPLPLSPLSPNLFPYSFKREETEPLGVFGLNDTIRIGKTVGALPPESLKKGLRERYPNPKNQISTTSILGNFTILHPSKYES